MGVEDREWWQRRQSEAGATPSSPTRAPGDELWNSRASNARGESGATWLVTFLLVTATVGALVLTIVRPPFVDALMARGRAWLASFNVTLPTAKAPGVAATEQVPSVPCDPTEEIRTMSTRWPAPRDALPGRSMQLVNRTGQEIFLRLHDAATGQLTQTALLMPREKVTEPVFSSEMTVQLRLGSVWCNRLEGWKDGRDVAVKSRIRTGAGVLEVVVEPAIGREGLSVVIQQKPNAPEGLGNPTHRSRPAPGAAPRPVPKVVLQPPQARQPQAASIERVREATERQEALMAQRQRDAQGQQSVENGPTHLSAVRQVPPAKLRPNAAASRDEHGTEAMHNVRISDWRDVPRRDLRLVTTGDRHFIGGQVAEEDVQFELSLHGYSAIGERLARAVGATGCQQGYWDVMGHYVGSCRTLVRSLRFGSVELDNVLMVVLPGNRPPVLGPDVLGKVRLFLGPDGHYASVGN